jgi:predicted nucleotidyltransferase
LIETRIATAQNVTVTDDALIVDLTDRRTVSVPLAWYPRLWHGTPEERDNWHLIGKGKDIHRPDLDEDISVDNLVLGKPSGESQRSFKWWLEARATPSVQTWGYDQVTTSVTEARIDTIHEPYLSQIKVILERVLNPKCSGSSFDCQISLFGSRATDQYHDVSDFDIGVLASRDISRELSIARELLEDSTIPFTVDLVDLSAASEEFATQVQREGILLELD